jgi:hypothetical protein
MSALPVALVGPYAGEILRTIPLVIPASAENCAGMVRLARRDAERASSIPRATLRIGPTVADSTVTASITVEHEVLPDEGVSVLALLLASVPGRGTSTSEDIDAMGHGFKMLRIHASPVSAQVVQRESFGDSPHQAFIHKSMTQFVSRSRSPSTDIVSGITLRRFTGGPVPTSGLSIDNELATEPLGQSVEVEHGLARLLGQRADGGLDNGRLGQPELLRELSDQAKALRAETVTSGEFLHATNLPQYAVGVN